MRDINTPWNGAEDMELRQLRSAGLSNKAIAERLTRTESAVKFRISVLLRRKFLKRRRCIKSHS